MMAVTLPFRLLALDIDGTLLNSEFSISGRDLEALRRVHEAGAEVILCTGRRHAFALPIAQQLGFELWLCSSNGAVTRSTSGEHFHSDKIPAASVKQLLAHMDDFRRQCVLTFDQETKGALVLEQQHALSGSVSKWIEKNAPFIEYVSPLEHALTEDPIQAMFCGSLESMRRAEAALATFPGLGSVTVLKTEYLHRDLCLLDVLNRDCSKGHAVERWARYRGISREQVMAIGDNHNDIEMLQFAGIPVVMGNACDELKQMGFRQTLCNDECGVASAIEEVLGWAPDAVG
jgi:Cof subfamily protein (haloacid dehalogenase superfamily)